MTDCFLSGFVIETSLWRLRSIDVQLIDQQTTRDYQRHSLLDFAKVSALLCIIYIILFCCIILFSMQILTPKSNINTLTSTFQPVGSFQIPFMVLQYGIVIVQKNCTVTSERCKLLACTF